MAHHGYPRQHDHDGGFGRMHDEEADYGLPFQNMRTMMVGVANDSDRQKESSYIRTSPRIYHLPFGLTFLLDPGGYCPLGFIFFSWFYNSILVPYIVLHPQYNDGNISVYAVIVYYLFSLLTVVCLFRATTADPGRVEFEGGPIPPHGANDWSTCKKCLIQRPIKSHHCSRCMRCIRKMDHHCPWINNCVGEDNHWLFLLLVIYASLLSIYTFVLQMLYFYYLPACVSCDKSLSVHGHSRYFMYGVFVFAILLTIICMGQVYTQVINIATSSTTVESIIYAKIPAHKRPSLAKQTAFKNFKDVFGTGWVICWLNPFRRSFSEAECL
ncbi:probable palmitoyltransferase ZDHHC21 isoform X2 [Anneissia japonica]|uniref:probable palmitoyltransferase ZDHHC21 isoform X2 n=1 Tax=Anneissia japonica TaxID=1529436 RepID=UPI001425687F|nr:probable palmitoyltransferase ZDHHC21 isoform X2 [Anneissia japonica]